MRYECHINYDDCDLCNECVECCSGKALTISNDQIQFKADKCTNCEVCSDVCLGASSEFTVSPIKSNYRIFIGNSGSGKTRYGYRTTSTINAGGSTSGEVSLNTTHNMKIVKEGTLFKYYLNDRLLGSKTITGFWVNYHMFGVHTVQWNRGTTTISDLKIKQI